jgi:hypothetical protein
MPLVQYYTLDGTLVGQENATSIASNGTWMQIPAFNISQLPAGTYAAFVNNAASGGGTRTSALAQFRLSRAMRPVQGP